MANDATRPVRRTMLTALKADEAVTALVSASSIYPQATTANPGWPFIRYGSPTGVPVSAACVDGAEITVAVHGFAKPRFSGSQIIETAEDHAARIGAAIATALGGRSLALEGGGNVRLRWTGSQLFPDADEADAFHTVQNFIARVIA